MIVEAECDKYSIKIHDLNKNEGEYFIFPSLLFPLIQNIESRNFQRKLGHRQFQTQFYKFKISA